MAKEQFNPWPSFVDLFSSVILVLILLLLIVLVNLGYYAQFKFKTSYTGTITTDSVILNDNPSANKVDEVPEKIETKDTTLQVKNMERLIKQIQMLQQQQNIQQEVRKETNQYILETPGITINKDDDKAEQNIIEKDQYMVVNFSGSEVFMSDAVIKKVKSFIVNATQKYPGNSVKIFAGDPKNQLSATVAKQISLGRTLSVRNLIRKFGYEKKDVNVDLMGDANVDEKLDNEQGYILIRIVPR